MKSTFITGLAAAMALSFTASCSQENVEVIPFDLSSGRPVIEITINGEGPFPFIFDTGAGGVVIGSSLFEELGLDVTGSSLVGSPAGGDPIAVDMTQLDSLRVGGVGVETIDATIMDFGDPRQMQSVGVFGPNVFTEHRRVAFDFVENRIEIGGSFRQNDDANWIDFSPTAPIIEIPLTIGDVTVPVHIDTGSPSILNFPEGRVEELPLTGPLVVIGEARTVDRTMQIMGAPIAGSASFGDAELPLTRISSFPLPFANIGSGGLRGLYLEIDWERQRFAVSGTADPVSLRRRRVRAPISEETE